MKATIAILLALVLTACGGTPANNQANADNIFGTAKMGLVVASGIVAVYNTMPACGPASPSPPLCYSDAVGDILNKSLAGASDAIAAAEKVFAAANTDEAARLKAANIAKVVITELVANLAKYGVTQVRAG